MKKRLKNIYFALLRTAGLIRLWRFIHRQDVVILMIHGTMAPNGETAWTPLRSQLDPQRLEKGIRLLSKHYRFVSLKDAVDMLTGRKPVTPNSLVFTFDDGYRNNVTRALPILQQYGVPATIFIATGHIERRKPFWYDRLDYVFQQLEADGREVRIGQRSIRLCASSQDAMKRSFKYLRDTVKAEDRDDTEVIREIEGVAAKLESECGRKLEDIFEEDAWSGLLTSEEIRGLAHKDGVVFGSHTVDHLRLSKIDEKTLRDQLVRSRQMVEEYTGRPCKYLCYPSGDFNLKVAEVARECGYEAAVTTETGTNRIGDDPTTLRRYNFPVEGDLNEFLALLSGLAEIGIRVKSFLGGKAKKADVSQ